MRKRRGLFLGFFVIVLTFILIPLLLFSYDDKTTHPALTQEMAELFNLTYPNTPLSQQEVGWLVQGSIDEDTWPRWINHFYDPVYNQPWTAEEFGWLSSSTAQGLNRILLSDYPPVTAKYWAQLPNIQAQYRDFGGNHTWQRALQEFVLYNNREQAFLTLGHVLHLLEDMTVPDHTRNDTHAHPLYFFTGDAGSPYEAYAKRFFIGKGSTNLPVTGKILHNLHWRPVIFPELNNYFDFLATYSNNYFFSKDTVLSSKYVFPKIVSEDDNYGYGLDKDGSQFPIVRKVKKRLPDFFLQTEYALDNVITDELILTNYFSRLSREAIIVGTGVIRLFFEQAAQVRTGQRQLADQPVEKSGIDATLVTLKQIKKTSPVIAPLEKTISVLTPLVLGEKIFASEQAPVPTKPAIDVETPLAAAPPSVDQPPVSGSSASFSGTFSDAITPLAPPPLAAVFPLIVPDIFSNTAIASTTESVATSTSIATSTIIVHEILPSSTSTTSTALLASTTTAPLVAVVATSSVITSSTPLVTPVFSAPLVINEIAWAGTSADFTNDEWLELYNTTDQPIDFTGWKIIVDGIELFISKRLTTNVPAHGYFLLEKQRNEVVREISADIIYSDVKFKNTGGVVHLVSPSGVVADEIQFPTAWPAGDALRFRTMERISVTQSGNEATNWRSNEGPRLLARSFNGGTIYGSPRQSNFGNIVLDGTQLDTERVLRKYNNPYILQYYTIPFGKTLTIEPGVVVKSYYSDAKVDVFGSFKAAGTGEELVVFTSGRDPVQSTTTIGSWSGVTPQSQDWQGIWLHPGASGQFNQVSLRYAGRPFRVNNYIFTGFISQGLRVEGAQFEANQLESLSNGSVHIHIEDSTSTIRQSFFSEGNIGIESLNSDILLEGVHYNGFSDPAGPLQIKNRWPLLNSLQFTNNNFNGVSIEAAVVTSSAHLTSLWPHRLNAITISAGATLEIQPGANIYFPQYGFIEVHGTLLARGTADKPIHFLPKGDQSWGSLRFVGGQGDIGYAIMIGGNSNFPIAADDGGMLRLKQSTVVLSNSHLLDGEPYGNTIWSRDSSLVVVNSLIGHSQKKNFENSGLRIQGGSTVLDNVTLQHLTFGVRGFGDPKPALVLNNLSLENFVDVDHIFDGVELPPLFLLQSSP